MLVIPDIYLYRDYSDTSSSYSLKAVLLPSPVKLMVFVIDVLNDQKLEMWVALHYFSSYLDLGSFQNSKWTIKNYNFLFSFEPKIKCLGFKVHTLQKHMQVFN